MNANAKEKSGDTRSTTSFSTVHSFKEAIEKSSKSLRSRIILALDLDYREDINRLYTDVRKLIEEAGEFICATKFNFHLLLPLSVADLESLNDLISTYGLVSIADMKLNDIDNTNRVATEYLWKAGFSAVIVNPFVGYEGGLDAVYKSAHSIGKGVISLAYMSHKGADEGYGLRLEDGRSIFDLFLDRANLWGSDGVIIGSTRPEKIAHARSVLRKEIRILSPGSGAQGGNPSASLQAGADYVIYGRAIVDSKNPRAAVKQIYESLLPWTETH